VRGCPCACSLDGGGRGGRRLRMGCGGEEQSQHGERDVAGSGWSESGHGVKYTAGRGGISPEHLFAFELGDGLPNRRYNKDVSKITQPTAPTVGFISLGCPKNLVDSEVMMGLLDRAGARLTGRPEDAEILVVNTCSFIDTAKQESVDTILEMARHKTEGRAKKLIVAGCLVERYRDEIRKNIPEVDAVVGTGELERILEAAGVAPAAKAASPFNILSVAEVRAGQESLAGSHKELAFRAEGDARERQGRFTREDWQGAAHLLPTYLYDENTPRLLTTGRTSAYIKIAEGCDHPCTFCVIPNLRGKFRSRRFESVVAEARRLVAGGVREITLIGQDTTCYGEDLGLKDGLALLLDELAKIEGLRWLRFLYAYPNRITGRLLETMARTSANIWMFRCSMPRRLC
jgi:ribosomal protein S12 methylthiotransferase